MATHPESIEDESFSLFIHAASLEYKWDNAVGLTVYRKLAPSAIQTPQANQRGPKA